MPKYQIEIVRPVTDYLRAFVEIEAPNESDALDKAYELDLTEVEFDFWQCGDCLESTTYEATEISDAKP